MIDQDHCPGAHPPFWKTRYAVGWLVMAGVATFYLVTQHLAHLMGALPYLLFLACPLMHLFMHRGRGHRHQRHDVDPAAPAGSSNTSEFHAPR